MSIEIKVPVLPESVTDATIAKWYKKVGDSIARDENLVDLETDKVMLEVPATQSGVIESIAVAEGEVVTADQLLAVIAEGEVAAPAAESAQSVDSKPDVVAQNFAPANAGPAARRAASEKGVDASKISGSGKGGRVTVEDVQKHGVGTEPRMEGALATAISGNGMREEKRVPMSRLRQRVAQRLKQVQNEAAILTTFNEINMKPVMDLRKKYKDEFEKTFGTRLGFMSFFTKAAVEALKQFPAVNASIDGTDILYHNYYDVGIAIGSERGLVVPVIRDCDQITMADIEKQIRGYAAKAGDGKIALEDMMGGTFTITNAGTYGSMMSTPIINPPQSGILGMHNIVERPVVENEIL